MMRRNIIIMGAAGRDFHNFNMVYREDPLYDVKAFTAAQIPFIDQRVYPPELAGPLYPEGIPIYPEDQLDSLISHYGVNEVVFAYSDVSHEQVMHRASLCLSLGADFILLGPHGTMVESVVPVISVCAVRTGCGKSGVTRYVLKVLRDRGLRPVAIRHPMPYCDLTRGRLQRFGTREDLEFHSCTLEEREEYEPLIQSGVVVFAGVDYAAVLKEAEKEADIIVWDGGNNDLPFVRPGLEIVVFDPYRAGHELLYHPGETNLRRADIAVINKVDTAGEELIRTVEHNVRMLNPYAVVVRTESRISTDAPEEIRGKRVLVVEDGPTVTHGGMPYGAGYIAAQRFGAAEIIDPRPYARGSIGDAFSRYPHIGSLLPAMGYGPAQIGELAETIRSVPCDLVLIATPVDLGRLLSLDRPVQRVRYEIAEANGFDLKGCIEGFVDSVRH